MIVYRIAVDLSDSCYTSHTDNLERKINKQFGTCPININIILYIIQQSLSISM